MSDSDLEFEERDLMLEIADFLEEFVHSDKLKEKYAGDPLCGLVNKKFCLRISNLGYFAEWPGFGGDHVYPVGGEAEFEREWLHESFWQNPKRLDLTLYVAKRLREDALK